MESRRHSIPRGQHIAKSVVVLDLSVDSAPLVKEASPQINRSLLLFGNRLS